LEDEIIIIEVQPRIFNIKDEPGKYSFSEDYCKEVYAVNRPITHKPEYLAIRAPQNSRIELVFKIDEDRSDFPKGRIVPEGIPSRALIPLRIVDSESTSGKIWYTSFGKLFTHESTDEFMQETTNLCNGYYCIHHAYCKFFSQSPMAHEEESVESE
jgi:hypothetical protein